MVECDPKEKNEHFDNRLLRYHNLGQKILSRTCQILVLMKTDETRDTTNSEMALHWEVDIGSA